ncbi:uncharacterized protein LOC120355937 [Nilaparvata lugens]|uniref:uncharacterized protein LOC120355937 n=1 Tax=Nilaparvata lugens TaxID=108931 RepID=UPI00193D6806|nr:uncharacterized protein LOC120355937 [Nilaparvata lugens]
MTETPGRDCPKTPAPIEWKEKTPESDLLEAMLSAIMKVSALVGAGNGSEVDKAALTCSDHLYQHLCNWSKTNNDFSLVSNTLLVHLGLMKSEDKSFKITYNTVDAGLLYSKP